MSRDRGVFRDREIFRRLEFPLPELGAGGAVPSESTSDEVERWMKWNDQDRGPWRAGAKGSKPADLEEFLRRGQDRLRSALPGNLGGQGIALLALVAVVVWGFSGFFRVEPDELGIVLRFGKYVRDAQPGLNFHMPYPIEFALTPKVHASIASISACVPSRRRAAALPISTCRRKA